MTDSGRRARRAIIVERVPSDILCQRLDAWARRRRLDVHPLPFDGVTLHARPPLWAVHVRAEPLSRTSSELTLEWPRASDEASHYVDCLLAEIRQRWPVRELTAPELIQILHQLPPGPRRFTIRDLDANESDALLRDVLALTDGGLTARSIGHRLGPRMGDKAISAETVRSWRREARRMRAEGLI